MVRVAVVYCLVLSTAAGPWLCCCAAARAADVRPLFATTLGLGGGNHPGCCGHRHDPARGHPTDQDTPGRDAPGECPCKALNSVIAAVVPERAEVHGFGVGYSTDLGPWGLCDTRLGGQLVASASNLRDRVTSLHSGNPRDALAILQTLRC
jgi:hypothetical protein